MDDETDPRLADFVALNDPARRRQVERSGSYFVVEGVLAVERLLALPQWEVRSIALLPRLADRLAEAIEGRFGVPPGAPDCPVSVVDQDALNHVVGFDLHRGALASVTRRPPPRLDDLDPATLNAARLLVMAEGINDHENLGGLYRNAAAFGVDAMVLDPTSADPFYRRSVRVSLGHVLAVPTVMAPAHPAGIEALRARGVTVVALTPTGDVDLRDLDRPTLDSGPVAVLVGAEGPGLSEAALTAADHRVRITMATGVDSLNVATAAAVALHHLRR